MTDVKSRDPLSAASDAKDDVFAAMEALFFAYRDFTREPDAILAQYGFGRAHHRVLHFVFRRPGMTVAELLNILQITKQSLSRVLRQLIDDGFVEQVSQAPDRRRRLLYLTKAGEKLIGDLSDLQRTRFEKAFELAGPAAVSAYHQVMAALMDGETRGREKS